MQINVEEKKKRRQPNIKVGSLLGFELEEDSYNFSLRKEEKRKKVEGENFYVVYGYYPNNHEGLVDCICSALDYFFIYNISKNKDLDLAISTTKSLLSPSKISKIDLDLSSLCFGPFLFIGDYVLSLLDLDNFCSYQILEEKKTKKNPSYFPATVSGLIFSLKYLLENTKTKKNRLRVEELLSKTTSLHEDLAYFAHSLAAQLKV